MQSVGIQNNYQQEYRRAWLCYAVSLITINIFDILTAFFERIFYYKEHVDTWLMAKMVLFDILETSVITTISTSFVLLLRSVYIRFAALNRLLRYCFSISINAYKRFSALNLMLRYRFFTYSFEIDFGPLNAI